MFGIEKDFQDIMEVIYGPLNKDKMTDEIDISKVLIEGDTATIMGVKYRRIEEPQSFYDKLSELLETEIGDDTPCGMITDMVTDLIREHIPEPYKEEFGMEPWCLGYNECIRMIREKLR